MKRFLTFALGMVVSSAAWAQQTVVLRDGTQFTGKLVGVNGDSVTFRDDRGENRRFDSNQIDAIRFDQRQDYGNTSYRRPDTGNSADSRGYGRDQNSRYRNLPAGTEIAVRTNERIDSQDSNQGRSYSAEVGQDVVDRNGNMVLPRGSEAQLVVRRIGQDLALDLQSVSVNGERFAVNTADVTESGAAKQGVGDNKRTAEYVGGAAVLGTLLGAIAGGGRGAAIGALAGGAAGAGAQVLTRGSQVTVPAETMLNFRLDSPVSLDPIR